MSSTFFSLSSEIIWRIIQLLEPLDLSHTRQVSKRLRTYCDHPRNWTSISLIAPITNAEKTINLWNPTQLRHIIQPHLQFIQTLCISGVRDTIIRYLLQHCHHLQTLTLFGWSTLSNHAFSHPLLHPSNRLRSLRLVGQSNRPRNFTSLDTDTFRKFMSACPHLEEISMVNCQLLIQMDPLLKLFGHVYVYQSNPSFNSFIVASKRPLSSDHIKKIFRLYFSSSHLKYLLPLMPGAGPCRTIDLDLPIQDLAMPTTS